METKIIADVDISATGRLTVFFMNEHGCCGLMNVADVKISESAKKYLRAQKVLETKTKLDSEVKDE